ncbi:MAG: biotin transporter BioY [Rhodospirillaceae bacterium]|nr:biotin transporter BioY [Rhodospirillaceae bacterium]
MHPTLAATLWPTEGTLAALRWALLAVGGSLFVAASAQIQVPLWPVPITMQTFAVLLVGAAYGARLGAATLALYLIEGAAGLPVFAGLSGGPGIIVGPTGGYIVGFVLAAGLVGWLAERGWDRHAALTGAAMVLGNLAIYALGLAWLWQFTGEKTLALGLVPFLPGDALKIALAMAVLPAAWRLITGFRR